MKLALTVAPLAALLACSTPSQPTTPPAAPPSPGPILGRFTRDIWPAIAAFNADSAPIHNPYAVLGSMMADNSVGPSIQLYNAAGALGYPPETARAGGETMTGNDGLHLHTLDLQKIEGDTAELNVCYTYTHYWSIRQHGTLGDSLHEPGISQATFGLHNRSGTWMLDSIANDHTVTACESDKA